MRLLIVSIGVDVVVKTDDEVYLFSVASKKVELLKLLKAI